MSQKDLVLRWNQDGDPPTIIHNKLMDIFDDLAISLSTVSRTIRELSWNKTKNPSEITIGRPPNYSYDSKILNELKNDSTISCREISRITNIPYSTVYYILITRLNFKCRRLHWIPHILNQHQKNARLKYSRQLLSVLQSCCKNKWKFILTVDESWFCYFTPNGCQWINAEDEPPIAERPGFYSSKIMLTIFWNPHGIGIIDTLPRGSAMNGSLFISHILEPLTQYPQNLQAKKKSQKILAAF